MLNDKYIFILLFVIIACKCRRKGEPYTDYPISVEKNEDILSYALINEKLKDQSVVEIPKGYQKIKEMYPYDIETGECLPTHIPTSYYNKN